MSGRATPKRGHIDVPPIAPSPTVLLLVDFINPLRFPGADELAPRAVEAAIHTAALKERLGRKKALTIYANDNYGSWSANFETIWRGCRDLRGHAGKMARLLRPLPGDCTILKPRHSAFYATPLEILLRQVKCRRLIVTGLATYSCVLFSAMDGYLRGYSIWVPENCTAAEDDGAKTQALEHIKRTLKAKIAPAT